MKTKQVMVTVLCLPLVALIIFIGLYPFAFLFAQQKIGILQMKSDALLANLVWKAAFYTHILPGGVALLVGWVQFMPVLRRRWPGWHRWLGRVYVVCAWLSGAAGVCISFTAEGGPIAIAGFLCIGLGWLLSTTRAYTTIRRGDVAQHRRMMIFSYAFCLGAVTLRVWLPTLTLLTHDFIFSYRIVAWLSWVPNTAVAYWITRRVKMKNEKMNVVM